MRRGFSPRPDVAQGLASRSDAIHGGTSHQSRTRVRGGMLGLATSAQQHAVGLRVHVLLRGVCGSARWCAPCVLEPAADKTRRKCGGVLVCCAVLRCAHAPETPERARRYCDGELGLQAPAYVPAVACGNAPTYRCRAGGLPQRMATPAMEDRLYKCRQKK